MADPKYKATAVALKTDQAELLNKARDILAKKTGVDLSRSQAIAYMCNKVIQAETKQ